MVLGRFCFCCATNLLAFLQEAFSSFLYRYTAPFALFFIPRANQFVRSAFGCATGQPARPASEFSSTQQRRIRRRLGGPTGGSVNRAGAQCPGAEPRSHRL